jgi:hypothetical protein
VFTVDVGVFEAKLHAIGSGVDRPRPEGSTLPLAQLVQSLLLTQTPTQRRWQPYINNAGNGAFVSLYALQKLLDPEHTPPLLAQTAPVGGGAPPKPPKTAAGMGAGMGTNMGTGAMPNGSPLQIPVVPVVPPAGYSFPVAHRPSLSLCAGQWSATAPQLVHMSPPPSARRLSWVEPQPRGPVRSGAATVKHRWSSVFPPVGVEDGHADGVEKEKESGVDALID